LISSGSEEWARSDLLICGACSAIPDDEMPKFLALAGVLALDKDPTPRYNTVGDKALPILVHRATGTSGRFVH
jgi:hypothetical protein